jgi:hypothetical protein
MSGLLHIYDDSLDYIKFKAGVVARSAALAIGVSTRDQFWKALDDLTAKGVTFEAMIVSTHGDTGQISLGDDSISAWNFNDRITKGYSKLFPRFSKIYFVGCEIMKDSQPGLDFLVSAGRVFLRQAGGIVMAHDTHGVVVGWPQLLFTSFFVPGGLFTAAQLYPFLNGKIARGPWDEVTAVVVLPGGYVSNYSTQYSWFAN